MTRGCGPLYVQFTDYTPKAATWAWDFGNGNIGNTKKPTAIYTTAGSYTISLKVTDSNGIVYNLKKSAHIKVFKDPMAAFSGSLKKVCPNDSMKLSESCILGDTSLKKYGWDFGDGTTSSVKNPSHAWTVPGYKNISLVVTDNHGCSNQVVYNAIIRVLTPPVANFFQDSTFSCAKGLKVSFSNNSSPPGFSSQWDFGDGSAYSNTTDPIYNFKKFGKYNVTLKVWDKNTGCYNSNTVFQSVIIDSLTVDFDAKNKIICDKTNPVNFINLVTNFPDYKAVWKFGDGTTSSDWLGNYIYSNYGTYSVTLEIKGSRCFAKKTIPNFIKVNPIPKTTIRMNDTGVCGTPFTMKLIAKAPSTSTISWDFGDTKSGTGNIVSHLYTKPDSFYVTAFTTDKSTCRDTQHLWVKTNELSVYAAGQLEGCIPLYSNMHLITYKNTASTKRIEWFYKNIRIDSGTICKYKFTDTGIYKIRLKILNSKACIDTPDVVIKAGIKVKPSFKVNKNKVCLNDSVIFTNTTLRKSPVAHEFEWFLGEGDVIKGNPVSMTYKTTQGNAQIILRSKHFGCVDTASSLDSVFVKTPRVAYKLPKLGCTLPNPLIIINETSTYTNFKWFTIPTEQRKNNDTIFINTSKNAKFELHMVAVNDTNNCADSAKYGFNFLGNLPHANANYKIVKPCPPAEILFKDSSSIGGQTYWKMPNGDTIANALLVNYTIANYGNYYCTRYAVNQYPYQTCIDSMRMKIVIPKPDARFSLTPSTGCTPLLASFSDSGYFKKKKGNWKFGDTQLTTTGSSNPFAFMHPFDSLKTKVIFTAWDSLQRCTATSTQTVQLSGPKASINAGYFYTCKITKLQLGFNALSKGIRSWEWFADDTALGNSTNPEFIVYVARNVKVELRLIDSFGCKSSYILNYFVRVYKPDVKIASDTAGALCPPLIVRFFDKSTSFNNPVETWLWDFGDGSGSTLKNPAHTFLNSGIFNIKLTVKNFVGCYATKTFPVYIHIFGPKGKIVCNIDSGCTPLIVGFSSTNAILKTIHWDFGDGNEARSPKINYVYKNEGIYTPSAILEDSNGCTLGVQASFKIRTIQSSFAAIKQLNYCDNAILNFADSSDYFNSLPKNVWSHGSSASSGNNFTFKSTIGQRDSLHFIAFGNLGCNDTIHFRPRKSSVQTAMNVSGKTACVGEQITLGDKSISDTQIVCVKWTWENADYPGKSVLVVATTKGYQPIKLWAQNALGCLDSSTQISAIFVGDSATPKAPLLHAVTVTGDVSQQILFKPENTPDWSKYMLYHTNTLPYLVLQNSTNINTSNFDVNGIISLLNPQCFTMSNTNICFKESNLNASIIHCTVELKTKSDTNKIILNWTPYVGENVAKYIITRADFPSANFKNLDSVAGSETSYVDTWVQCTNKYSYRIIAQLNSLFSSYSDTTIAQPIYKSRSLKPWIHKVTVDEDKSIHLEFEPIQFAFPAISSYNIQRRTISSFVYTKIQDIQAVGPYLYSDKNVDSDNKLYYYILNTEDICGGNGNNSATSSNILLQFGSNTAGDVNLVWNPYKFWPGGVNQYEMQQKGEDQIYRTVQVSNDTFIHLKQPGARCGSLPWFRIKAISNVNRGLLDSMPTYSYSNEIVLSDKPVYFIPNVFTPNNDALNPTFKPSLYWAKDLEMEIFNRWGQKIFEVKSCDASWNGDFQGMPAPEGTYAYRLKITGINGKSYYLSGVMQLLR